MPVLDFLFALLPAPEYFLAVELAVEVHQPLLEAFEYTPDLLELAQEIVDPPRDLVDAARSPTCSADSPHSGRACAATSSYFPTKSRHSGCSVTRSATMRFTSGSVRLASARVKYLRGTGSR